MFYKKVFGPFHPQAHINFYLKLKKLKFRENLRRKISNKIKKSEFFFLLASKLWEII